MPALGLAEADPTASEPAAAAWHELGDVEGEVMSLLYAANLYGHRGEAGRESRSYSEKDSPPRTPRRVTKRVTAAGRDAAHIDASTMAAPAGWFHVTDSDRIVTPRMVSG